MRENDLYKEVSKKVMPDFDEMKNNIVLNKAKKSRIKPLIAVAACLVLAVGVGVSLKNLNHYMVLDGDGMVNTVPASGVVCGDVTIPALDTTVTITSNDKIVYNKLGAVGSNSLAARCELKNGCLGYYNSIISLIPEELNECSFEEIYVVPDNLEGTEAMQDIENYTVRHTCQLRFVKPESSDAVIISFSDKGEPLRDTVYECGKKKSLIGGQEITLTGDIKDGLCLANFALEESGNKIYFDIEFSGIKEEEMLAILNEVINKSEWGHFYTQACEEEITEGIVSDTPEEIFSNAHITTEPPETSQGNFVGIEGENEIITDRETMPAYAPSAD